MKFPAIGKVKKGYEIEQVKKNQHVCRVVCNVPFQIGAPEEEA
jgi:hypothetical protein